MLVGIVVLAGAAVFALVCAYKYSTWQPAVAPVSMDRSELDDHVDRLLAAQGLGPYVQYLSPEAQWQQQRDSLLLEKDSASVVYGATIACIDANETLNKRQYARAMSSALRCVNISRRLIDWRLRRLNRQLKNIQA